MAEEQVIQSEKTGETTTNSSGAEGKSYTQTELNQMFADRARQAESSLLKKLGFEKADEAFAALSKLKTIEDGQKSELQKAQEKIAELESLHTEQAQKQKDIATQYEVVMAATKLGIVDVDAAYKLLDKTQLSFDDKTGKFSNTEQLLKALLTEKPWLAGGGTSASNRARNYGDGDDPLVTAMRQAAGLDK